MSGAPVRVEATTVCPDGFETSPAEQFADNLDHLVALEREATLLLASAFLRRLPSDAVDLSDPGGRFRDCFPSLPPGMLRPQVAWLSEETAAGNRRREAIAEQEGVVLTFPALCRQWRLTAFERSALMLLLMQFTSPPFASAFRQCGFERERQGSFTVESNFGMEIGTLLSVVCRDYREQLECRRHFSLDGTLLREGIVSFYDGVGEATNLLGTKVSLPEQTVRTILGDDSVYSSSLRFLRRERIAVSFDQVVLAEGLKEEIAACVGNFLKARADGRLDALDGFFGYGTGFALLFHGPSGTGKTMLARALAHRFGRQTISFSAETVGKFHSPEEILATVFREAEMQGAIVLLDECDDLFENDSRLSQALLTELEKSRCVVILATNKPVDLDPALERRIARKVAFPIPAAEERLRIWRSLLPVNAEVAPDVDFAALADRYQFPGGLIKNCLLLAAAAASREGGGTICIAREQLERAAELQAPSTESDKRVCRRYAPTTTVEELQVRPRARDQIRGAARAWRRLKAEGLGLNVLISAGDVAAGVRAAEALATECGLAVRSFPYLVLRSTAEANWIVDPVTQRKLPPLDYAFSESIGGSALTLIVDYAAHLDVMLDGRGGEESNFYLDELQGKLRSHSGLFCMVTWALASHPLPPEFHLHFPIEKPFEHLQIRRWEELLAEEVRESEIVELVERWPMHVEEIDVIGRQAAINAVIRGAAGRPGLEDVRAVIARYKRTDRTRVLFGGE